MAKRRTTLPRIKYHPTMVIEFIPEYPFFRIANRLTEAEKKHLKGKISGFDFGKVIRVKKLPSGELDMSSGEKND